MKLTGIRLRQRDFIDASKPINCLDHRFDQLLEYDDEVTEVKVGEVNSATLLIKM
jgi:hypothetical protein